MSEDRARFEVLMENVETSLKVLAEAHVAQVERLDRIDGRLERVETKVDKLDIRVGVLETKVDKLETKFDKLETKVDKLDTKVDKLDTKVDKLDTKVDKLDTKVDKLDTRFKVFASDTQQRLGRIETHLHMNGAHPRRSPQQPTRRSKKR